MSFFFREDKCSKRSSDDLSKDCQMNRGRTSFYTEESRVAIKDRLLDKKDTFETTHDRLYFCAIFVDGFSV